MLGNVQRRPPRLQRHRAITSGAEQVLGTPVGVALPVQRHPPHRMLTVAGLEVVVFALLALTGSLVVLGAAVACAAALLVLAATNTKRVLAVNRRDMVVLAATLRSRPVAPIGQPAGDVTFPEPRGVGVPIELADGRWWVDRVHYPRLRRARELRPPPTPGA